jgi:hypothetical protein
MAITVKRIVNLGGKQFYRTGPIYCTEIRDGLSFSYEVDDAAEWDHKRAEALKAAQQQ